MHAFTWDSFTFFKLINRTWYEDATYLNQSISFAKLWKALEAYGCKSWVNQFINRSPYIRYTNHKYCYFVIHLNTLMSLRWTWMQYYRLLLTWATEAQLTLGLSDLVRRRGNGWVKCWSLPTRGQVLSTTGTVGSGKFWVYMWPILASSPSWREAFWSANASWNKQKQPPIVVVHLVLRIHMITDTVWMNTW